MVLEIFSNSNYMISALVVIMLSVIVYLIFRLLKSEKKRDETQAKFLQLEKRIDSVQLKGIESKLNPHLFKNVLNSIQSHAYQTYITLDKLANVLDYILYESQRKFVTPKEEIEFALSLIEINKIKVSPLFDLTVKKRIDETEPFYNEKVLAPLISIDLIENAFKHANLQSSDAFISIIFEIKNDIFSLTVSNKISSRDPLNKEKSGIGANSLEQRLNILYKNNYKLERYIKEDVYIAHLKINLLEQKTKMRTTR